jgi:peptide-methionine (S)-S-oxide reductase
MFRFTLSLLIAAFIAAGLVFFTQNRSRTAIAEEAKAAKPEKTETATFGAGCFWGVESTFRKVPGVIDVKVGYTGGKTENPTYKEVCTDKTGHAEAVNVVYDPAKVNYQKLMEVFFENHDPTTKNRQGPDWGTQYRSAIFFHDETQEKLAAAEIKKRNDSGEYVGPIVTELVKAGKFYNAEEYHQQYFAKRGEDYVCHTGNGKKKK